MKATVALSCLLGGAAVSTAFVAPKPASIVVGAGVASLTEESSSRGSRTTVMPFLSGVQTRSGSSLSVASATKSATEKAPFKFEGYNKPIVLIGSSSGNNELQRLATSLSSALTGHNTKVLQSTYDTLKAGKGSSLVSGDSNGIYLSIGGADDADLVDSLVAKGHLTLTSGVIVLDFKNNPDPKELNVVAKMLYEEEGLMSVYVNVKPDGISGDKALEKDVFIPYSDYELCIKGEGAEGDAGWADMEWELQRIIARALLPSPIVGATSAETPYNSADLMMGPNTFFLSLSFPQIEQVSPYVEKMCQDVDYMEYRVDLLDAAKDFLADAKEGKDPRFDIMYQQQRLRTLCRPHAQRAPALPFSGASIIDNAFPIVYTVRTAGQAGTWPDDATGIKKMFDLLELGLRSGVEVLDVESAWDKDLTNKLMHKAQERYTSLILGSHHVVGTQVPMDEAVSLFRQCRIQERAHGAKVVLSILSNDNGEDMLAYNASLAAVYPDEPEIPNISLLLGEIGTYSRVINPGFTPVTHESLPFVAAPGQLTAAEIMKAKVEKGLLPAKKFGILGHNIGYSVSPMMQGAAIEACKLPHTYDSHDIETVEEFVKGSFFNDPNFGGCSVTIPHKVSIKPYIDEFTDAVEEIGSVNTIIVKKDAEGKRTLIGDNTDWKGIYNPLRRKVGDEAKGDEYALVLGGGGTARAAAFAAKKLGLKRIYWNRTPEKAQDLADSFGGVVASTLEDDKDISDSLGSILAENGGKIKIVISTIPKTAKFTLPDWLLADTASLPVVLDVNYKPYTTPLLAQVVEAGCDVVRGSEMLWEQGAGQFELWNGRMAPYGTMKKVVLDNCLPGGVEAEE